MNIDVSVSGVQSTKAKLAGLREYASGGRTTYVVGTNVHYAPYQEFGTYKMSPNPFMRPAANEVRANIRTYLSQASTLGDAVRLAALDVERRAKSKAPVDTGRLRASITAREQ